MPPARIVIFEGDTAESLAREFCEKHDIDEEMEQKLTIMLE